MFDLPTQKVTKEITNPLDKALIERAITEHEGRDQKDWVIRPLIFDANEDVPISTPILSGLSFNTISDSALDIIANSRVFSDDLNKLIKHEAYNNLGRSAIDNIVFTILNNIIESSTLTFNAWWESMWKKYFPFLENTWFAHPTQKFYSTLTSSKDDKYYIALDDAVFKFAKTTAGFNEMDKCINRDPDTIRLKGMYCDDYVLYMDYTSINLANLIGIIMIDSITNFLFTAISLLGEESTTMDAIKQYSPAVAGFSVERLGTSNFVHTAMEYILQDSLYDLIQNYIKPSIYNILSSSVNSFFFVYYDLERLPNETENK